MSERAGNPISSRSSLEFVSFLYNTRKGGVQLFETHSYFDWLKKNPLQSRTPRHGV